MWRSGSLAGKSRRWHSLGLLAHGAGEEVEILDDIGAAKETNIRIEPVATGQVVIRDLDIANDICFIDFTLG